MNTLTFIEQEIADAIYNDIDSDEGGFETEVEINGILYVAIGRYVTEGCTLGGDYWTPGQWVTNYSQVDLYSIEAFRVSDGSGDRITCSLNIYDIEEYLEDMLCDECNIAYLDRSHDAYDFRGDR